MKKLSLLAALTLLTVGLFAQTSTTPAMAAATFIGKSKFYEVTSYTSQTQADELAQIMDALFARYNSYFLFDATTLKSPLKVTMFANRKEYDAFLADKIKGERPDYIFLSYGDSAKSVLAAYPTENQLNNLAFQGFMQYLWTFLPNPPVWIRNGFAYHFWDVRWDADKKVIEQTGALSYLDSLKIELAKNPNPDLAALLELDDAKDGTLTPANDYLSWGLVYFLLSSENQTYTRLMGNVLANISPKETLAVNSKAIAARLAGVKPLADLGKEFTAWVSALDNFSTLMEKGADKLKAKEFKAAGDLFKKAQIQRPGDYAPYYYQGLSAYENKEYTVAETFYAQAAKASGAPAGLVSYARGLNAFYNKDYAKSKDFLAAAIKENQSEYGKLAQEVLDLLK